jgi:hypothetical protein
MALSSSTISIGVTCYRLAVVALKAFVHPQDIGFVGDLKEEIFWEVLTPLLEGSVHSVKERARELVTQRQYVWFCAADPGHTSGACCDPRSAKAHAAYEEGFQRDGGAARPRYRNGEDGC